MAVAPQDHDPVEIDRIPVPRTGEHLHVGYAHDGTSPYVTVGQAGVDLIELEPETALAVLDALTTAIRHSHLDHCTRIGRLYAS